MSATSRGNTPLWITSLFVVAFAHSRPAAAQTSTGPSYHAGYEAAASYSEWLLSLQGDARLGAQEGGIRASVFPPASRLCTDPAARGCQVQPCLKADEVHSTAWTAACQEAETRRSFLDRHSWTDAGFKAGEESFFAEQKSNSSHPGQITNGEANPPQSDQITNGEAHPLQSGQITREEAKAHVHDVWAIVLSGVMLMGEAEKCGVVVGGEGKMVAESLSGALSTVELQSGLSPSDGVPDPMKVYKDGLLLGEAAATPQFCNEKFGDPEIRYNIKTLVDGLISRDPMSVLATFAH